MKLLRSIALVSAMPTLVNGFSFSEIAGEASPSNARIDTTDLTSDEESRIFGGSSADISKYSYIAKLIAGDMEDAPLCAGALIAPQYVLTSVYCLGWFQLDMHVSLGGQKNKDQGSQKSERIRAVEAFRHPMYNSTWYTYDVALIKLEKPSTHKPVRLTGADGSDAKVGTMASVFGWGSGDNGAPLISNGVVVGIASTLPGEANDCGELPDMYTRVSHVLDYINDVVNGGSTGNVTDSPPSNEYTAELSQ
ncbi:Cyclin-dependent kinase 5 [Phytophthora nicotianae]|uniref:Cyclin-dependent kinase 5 n=1 Tax=Phytophthora nicotianae TaxID=4792 RepID=A0A0W8DJ70_PHYNI|nr:Cyclin-dependent kinase 5 [Phytophthora nicotianae]